jgi:4-hydroxy-tetrahydrodipicolinate synthase
MQLNVITVIPTFFDELNNVNIIQIKKHINNQIELGIKTIVILGTTSEAPTLTIEEKLMIINNIYDEFKDKISIIVGVGGFDTKSVIDEINLYNGLYHALMISAPYYNKPTQDGLFQHFSHIISSIRKPTILYNVPSRTGVNIEPETIAKLYQNFKNEIIGIKEASGSIQQLIKTKSLCDVNILSGDDELILPFMAVGAIGVISVVSNIVPEEMILMVEHFKEGNRIEAIKIFYELYKLMKICFIETNPVPLKFLLSEINKEILPKVRLPLVELQDTNKKLFYNFLETV